MKWGLTYYTRDERCLKNGLMRLSNAYAFSRGVAQETKEVCSIDAVQEDLGRVLALQVLSYTSSLKASVVATYRRTYSVDHNYRLIISRSTLHRPP